jgi:hypothetical protein
LAKLTSILGFCVALAKLFLRFAEMRLLSFAVLFNASVMVVWCCQVVLEVVGGELWVKEAARPSSVVVVLRRPRY